MMQRPPKTFRQIIELWGSPDTLATELDVPLYAARKWYTRDKIPADWWLYIARSRRAREAGVTTDLLTKMAAR